MRKWFSFIALFVLLMIPMRASAQTAIGFESLDVGVWPEYDTPSVLVIYKIALTSRTTLPAEVTLRLPVNVTKAAVVAVGSTAATVSDKNVEYKFTPGTDFSSITIKSAARYIQVEYYDTNLTKNGNQRSFTYEWLGDYSVDTFNFELRKPLKASNLTSDPALSSSGIDPDGFEFSGITETAVKVGQKLAFRFQYQRDTDSPSTAFLEVQPSTPLDQTVPGQSTWTIYLPWILAGVGIIFLLISGWVFWVSGRANRVNVRSRKRHVVRSDHDDGGNAGQAHCSQCGKRTQQGDRFCRVCGTRIRRDEA